MIDAAAQTPLIGNGNPNASFMNVGLSAPVSGITPPYILGANLVVKTAPATFALFIYDPRDAGNREVWENPFSDGVTALASASSSTNFGGLPGVQGLKFAYSTQDGFNLEEVPELALPPEAAQFSRKNNRWYAAWSFQQYLHQDESDLKKGWGVFGQGAISDANPNVFAWSGLLGIGGNSPLKGRSNDRFGIGAFHYELSETLTDGLDSLGINLRGETGLEAYYNYEVTPWFHLTGDVQVVKPYNYNPTAVFLGLRGEI